MSLRDWFAGQALAGRMASAPQKPNEQYIQNEVEVAYKIADAMLEARR